MIKSEVLTVTGMKCGGCEANITGKLSAVDGVISVVASFKENEVTVEYDTEKTTLDDIEDIITDADFKVN